MAILLGFLATSLGRWAVICGMFLVAWFGFASHYKKVGAERVTAQIQQVTNETASKISSAADRSRNPSVRGKLDPTTRND